METLIIICLLIVIILLIYEKAANKETLNTASSNQVKKVKDPSVMGEPRRPVINTAQSESSKGEKEYPEKASERLNDQDVKEDRSVQISSEDLDEVFSDPIDLEEEEEEWKKYGLTVDYGNLAQGVTFEELNDAGRLLKSHALQSTEKEAASNLFGKIHGTELFALLESSFEGVSAKIAELLDNSFAEKDIKKDLTEFDINEFI